MNQQPDPIIQLRLPLSAINFNLNVLADRPYREVNGLIEDIKVQTQQQLDETQKTGPAEAAVKELPAPEATHPE